jgi:aspartyl-tRNA(Asn)/glutamyl-tRNA(Gln) amidotransferase subunit A
MSLLELPLIELAKQIEAKQISPKEITDEALQRIYDVNPEITSFVTVTEDLARSEAAEAEKDIIQGKYKGPLHGIPYAAKDLYNTAGIRTTSSSRVRKNFIPNTDAAAIKAMREAGMILVGKTETHEFAYGALTPQSGNPWDASRSTGGSSGGSGAAVAAGAVHVGLGTDTGGSIRIPAAICGTVGLKPTYGRVPRTGITPLSWSLDHAGPLTRNVIDAALVLDAMTEYDPYDPASVDLSTFTSEVSATDTSCTGVSGLRIGIPTNFFTQNITDDVKSAYENTIHILRQNGAELIEVYIPFADKIVATHRTIFVPEMSAYHMQSMHTTPELFTDEVRTANESGEMVLAVDYINAQRQRTRMKSAWRDMFHSIDVLLAPTTAGPALPRSDPRFMWDDGRIEEGSDAYIRLTCVANTVGLPSLQVPNGFTKNELPLGVQIIGRPFDEARVISVGMMLELETGFVGNIATPNS